MRWHAAVAAVVPLPAPAPASVPPLPPFEVFGAPSSAACTSGSAVWPRWASLAWSRLEQPATAPSTVAQANSAARKRLSLSLSWPTSSRIGDPSARRENQCLAALASGQPSTTSFSCVYPHGIVRVTDDSRNKSGRASHTAWGDRLNTRRRRRSMGARRAGVRALTGAVERSTSGSERLRSGDESAPGRARFREDPPLKSANSCCGAYRMVDKC